MAVIQARKKKRGTTYQVLIRANDGHPPAYKNFTTKQEAKERLGQIGRGSPVARDLFS